MIVLNPRSRSSQNCYKCDFSRRPASPQYSESRMCELAGNSNPDQGNFRGT